MRQEGTTEGEAVMAARSASPGTSIKYKKKRSLSQVKCFGCGQLGGHYKNKCPSNSDHKKRVMSNSDVASSAPQPKSSDHSTGSERQNANGQGFVFSAIGCRPRALYSEVVCAGMTAVKRSAAPTVKKTSESLNGNTDETPKLKRLIRPGESEVTVKID